MAERPYTLLSCAMSLDGYLGGPGKERLLLSNPADLDRVDAVRASSDAILVGAETLRHDNPRLLVRSPLRQSSRRGQGRPASPIKVTVTGSGRLDAAAEFFTAGTSDRLVYAARPAVARADEHVGTVATVVDGGEQLQMRWISEDLRQRGVRRLMVEGGGAVHTQFLTAGLADELQLVVAPFFVGDAGAPRFVGPGLFPWSSRRTASLVEVRQLGDLVLLRYALSSRYGTCERPEP